MSADNGPQPREFFEENFEYRAFVDSEQPAKAVEQAIALLQDRKASVGDAQYRQDHKGSIFYVLGYSSFACHDYTSASLYFDAAAEADLRHHQGSLDTPALKFIRLIQAPETPVLATDIIAEIVAQTRELLAEYHQRNDHHPITLDELRSRFFERVLQQGPAHSRTLLTAFISFVAEWKYRVTQFELIAEGSREPFFMHLLRGCVLFESLLKNAPNAHVEQNLGNLLHRNRAALGLVGVIRTSAQLFDHVAGALSANMNVLESINSCAQTRNTIGHNLVWTTVNLDPQAYDRLVRNIGVSCLHAISRMYL